MDPLINDDLMSILACPVCKGRLKLVDLRGKSKNGLDGELICVDCGVKYEIRDGIPILLPPDLK